MGQLEIKYQLRWETLDEGLDCFRWTRHVTVVGNGQCRSRLSGVWQMYTIQEPSVQWLKLEVIRGY